jgi:dimethylaniline monooxygenase (N-oxide forming)
VFAARCADHLPIDAVQTRHWHSLPVNEKAQQVRKTWRKIVQNGKDPVLRLLGEHILCAEEEPGSVVTKTERIFEAQAAGKLDIEVGQVEQIQGSRVTFSSGRQEDFDGIVLCTGFAFSLPFLTKEDQFGDIRDCYLQMFHPRLPEVAFLGFVRPQQGGIPLMAELQARYLALVWGGQRTLPSNIETLARADGQKWRDEFFATPHVFGLVNGLRYNENVADLIGCRPPIPNPVTHFDEHLRYWFHHIWPSQYRQVGPGAVPEATDRWKEAPGFHSRSDQVRMLRDMWTTRAKSLVVRDGRAKWRPIA